eukprot:254019-Amphidinium_carterae.1
MSGVSTFKTCTNIFINELLSTIESGQKEPHSNNKDASSRVKERRSMLLIACHCLCAAHMKSALSCYAALRLERSQTEAYMHEQRRALEV